MKIALVYDPIYPYVIGGAEKRYREFAVELAQRGHDVCLVGMKYWQGKSRIVENGVNLVGICKAVPLYGKNGKRSVFEALYFGLSVFLHVLSSRYDVIDCCSFPYTSALACRLALALKSRRCRPAFVMTWLEVWGKEYWKRYSGPAWFLGYAAERLASGLTRNNVAISVFTAKRMSERLGMDGQTVSVITCGINYAYLSSLSGQEKQRQVIYVGRLIEHKRVDTLIEAFSVFVKKSGRAEWILKIIGRGPQEGRCRETARERGIEDRTVFSGFLPEEELFSEIASSKAYVLPSEREGLGIAAVESMAMGTPVAALESENSALKDIIVNGRNGLLFRDPGSLVQALDKYISDEAFYRETVKAGASTAAAYDMKSVTAPKLEEYYVNANAVR